MKQEILHLLKVVLIGLCCKETKGHRDHKTFMSFPPLPYFHHNNEYYSPDFLSPFKNGPPPHLQPPQPPHLSLSHPPHLPFKSPTFPPFIHDNILPPPPFLPNVDFNFPFQPLPLQQNFPLDFKQNFPLDFNQNYLNNYYYFPYDTNIDTRDEFVKGPIQIIPSRFPPRIEALIERIQNYFSTYNQVEGQRPDYDPNLKPPLILPPIEEIYNGTVGNKIGNMTEMTETNETTTEAITTTELPISSSTTIRSIPTTTRTRTTTEKVEETTSGSEENEEPDTIGPIEIFLNKTESSEDDNKTEENHENEEPVEGDSGETFTEESEETTTERRNEETTENDVEVEVITLERKKSDDDRR